VGQVYVIDAMVKVVTNAIKQMVNAFVVRVRVNAYIVMIQVYVQIVKALRNVINAVVLAVL
jgi:hypothetical protein